MDRPVRDGTPSVTSDALGRANTQPLRVRGAYDNVAALRALVDAVPVGSIVAFMPQGDLRLPENWMYCNGDIVTDEASPLHGRRVPSLLDGRFLTGSVADFGQQGGSNRVKPDGAHDHGGTVPASADWSRTGPPTTNARVEAVTAGDGQIRVPEQGHRHMLAPHAHDIPAAPPHAHGGDARPAFAGVVYIIKIK